MFMTLQMERKNREKNNAECGMQNAECGIITVILHSAFIIHNSAFKKTLFLCLQTGVYASILHKIGLQRQPIPWLPDPAALRERAGDPGAVPEPQAGAAGLCHGLRAH
jgi:hypothetical protein